MKAPCGGSFFTDTCSLVIMAVKHTPFRVKLLNQYQRNLEKNPYCTVWYTSKRRVIFFVFSAKSLPQNAENFWKVCGHCRYLAINQIEINTCTFISTLCELFVVKNNRSMQFWRWDFRSFSKKYFWTWKAETATLFASWMYALLQFSIVTKLRADVSLFVPVKSILSRTIVDHYRTSRPRPVYNQTITIAGQLSIEYNQNIINGQLSIEYN